MSEHRRRGFDLGSQTLRGLFAWALRRRSEPDPFRVLAVQLRLARLSGEIAALQRDERQYAKAHHLQAATAAYDDALDEACELADIPTEREAPEAVHRLLAEAALRERGWTW